MNKHVNKLNKEANDARKMIEDSEDSDSDSDHDTKKGIIKQEGDNNKNSDNNRGSTGSGSGPGSGANAVPLGEKPTEEQVEKLEERLEAAQADQKNLFLIIFQVIQEGLMLIREP